MVVMDLQTLLIGLVICVISAILIYLIAMITMREQPYEEAMEAQKRKQQELIAGEKPATRAQKKDKKKKFKRSGKAGGGSDKAATESDSAAEEKREEPIISTKVLKSSKMVELELEPEVIEVSSDEPTAAIPKKNKATGKGGQHANKPILLNKDEKANVARVADVSAPELYHRKIVPKDAVELKHERERSHPESPQPELNGHDAGPDLVSGHHDVAVKPSVSLSKSEKKKKNAEREHVKPVDADLPNTEVQTSVKLVMAAPPTPPINTLAPPVTNGIDQLPSAQTAKKNKQKHEKAENDVGRFKLCDTIFK